MRLVVVESPYRAHVDFELQRNLAYARALCEHVTLRGDSVLASHLIYTQFLDDRIPEQRRVGIDAGLYPRKFADVHLFGVDLGVSDGMQKALALAEFAAETNGPIVEKLSLAEWAEAMAELPNTYKICSLIERYQPNWFAHESSHR